MSDQTAPSQLATGQVEIWKKIVDVQQHFNDLELRIRNFALVVTGAFLGLGGYAIKDGGIINAFGIEISISGLIVFSAIFPLFAFYFMDRLWYHRLLDGSVNAGIDAEAALVQLGYKVDLGSKISESSPFTLWFTCREIHSKSKMDIFYLMLTSALIIVALCLGFGIRSQHMTAPVPAQNIELLQTKTSSSSPESAPLAQPTQNLPTSPIRVTPTETDKPVSRTD